MEQAQTTVGQAVHGTGLETSFEETVYAAVALILAFHVDLASAAIALARRLRQAALAGTATPAELTSLARTATGLARRARLTPDRAGAARLDAAAALLTDLCDQPAEQPADSADTQDLLAA
ncbi:hypothetical protein GCM10027449_26380 [Sinomonas notoginsengisoli]|uniref:hypothetical protein n=1 Tax=Sinomonas notoginsengisoli TaxID=1457311 RepID=UPI001F228C91|nr:hypothetical protein [Sinomonas notoginsengisoli]